jgi:sugar/nucleoside kinase (ribokinase family)
MKEFDVYAIGNAIMDIQLQGKSSDLATLGLEKGSMQLVDVDTQKKILTYFENANTHQASGGSAANTVIALAQLGGLSAYGCLLANDSMGQEYASEMKHIGVALHNEPVLNEVTGSSVIIITEDAERTMNTHLGVSATFSDAHVCEEHMSRASWLYIEGYLFASVPGQKAIEKAIACAKKHNVKIAITFSDTFVISFFREPLAKAVSEASLIFANAHEAQAFTGLSDEEAVFASLTAQVPNVVMTLSDRGSWVRYEGVSEYVPGTKVTAVDATGAGDMYAGGFLYGITRGMSGLESGKIANFLAGKVVSQLGPRIHGDLKQILSQGGF